METFSVNQESPHGEQRETDADYGTQQNEERSDHVALSLIEVDSTAWHPTILNTTERVATVNKRVVVERMLTCHVWGRSGTWHTTDNITTS